MKPRRNRKEWRDLDVAEYLLANSEFDRWKAEEDGMVVWIATDGTETFMMDDLDDRASAVDRFIKKRGMTSRAELISEFRAVD